MQYDNLGKYIRTKRKGLSKSLNSFAFDCGIEPATLCNFEQQKSDILFQNFIKIAKGFKQTPAEFLKEFEKEN